MNLCSPCGLDFASVSAFDAHRVGKHAYTYSEGLKMAPMREDGRRCLTLREMKDAGWTQNRYGQWRRKGDAMPIDVASAVYKGKQA